MIQYFRFAAVAMAIAISGQLDAKAEVKVGDDAPAFELKGSDGKTYKMSELKGKKAVVIAWYPKAFTGG